MPEERRSHLHGGGSLKSCVLCYNKAEFLYHDAYLLIGYRHICAFSHEMCSHELEAVEYVRKAVQLVAHTDDKQRKKVGVAPCSGYL